MDGRAKPALSGNHLACGAMCGAATESVLLAIAIGKAEDEAKVLGLKSFFAWLFVQ